MKSQTYIILDYETRSEADLKKVGAYEYARHKTTQILCVSFRIGTKEELREKPVKTWSPYIHGKYPPRELIDALSDESIIKVAHNALFEQLITQFVLPRYIAA